MTQPKYTAAMKWHDASPLTIEDMIAGFDLVFNAPFRPARPPEIIVGPVTYAAIMSICIRHPGRKPVVDCYGCWEELYKHLGKS